MSHPPGGRTAVPVTVHPRLQVFPAEDAAFRRCVTETFDALCLEVAGRARATLQPEELQWRLRARYPAAVVRPRDPIADPVPGELVWYAYRFGSVAPGRRWWEEPGHAWAVIDDERRIAEASSALEDMVELPREALIGRPIEAFSNPADVTAEADVAGLWAELKRRGVLHATLRFRRLDGTPREIEYHITRDGAGPGRHLAIVREIEAPPG